jgi:hypothetical protein
MTLGSSGPHAYRGLVIILRLLVIAELIGDGTLGR